MSTARPLKQTNPRQVLGNQRRDLCEREDEDQIEEELKWSDSVLLESSSSSRTASWFGHDVIIAMPTRTWWQLAEPYLASLPNG